MEQKTATIIYNKNITAPEILRESIEDMGFDAFLPESDTSVKINIFGMTCQSCVNSIEGKIGTNPGVKSIKVDITIIV